ncbi:ABC transporter substrate-binding protein [Porticoccus sp.]
MLFTVLMFNTCHAGVLLLLSSDAPYYRETADILQATVSDRLTAPPSFERVSLDAPGFEDILAKPHQLIVAVGSNATREALGRADTTPLLSVFTPQNAFATLLQTKNSTIDRPIAVIYLDQPLSRVVSLATLLQPDATRFGTVFGPISREWESELKALTAERGIHLEQAYLNHNDNPVAVLRPLVQQSDLFIALPDQAVLNRAIAKWILHLSFQQKVPVIGFSKAYTNAGALASIYSAPADIGKHAGELIAAWLPDNPIPGQLQLYPRYFTISTNPAVARSLGISLPPENQLYRHIEQQEQPLP